MGADSVPRETPARRLEELARRHGLDATAVARLSGLLDLLAATPEVPTTVREPTAAVDVHIADSLSALALEALDAPEAIADLGAGAGFPSLVLAAARPASEVFAVESVGRKCEFLRSAADRLELRNLHVVCSRAESWTEGLNSIDVVCARALAPLGVLCEYAAPLLRLGGQLVAWKGDVSVTELASAAAAARRLGLSEPVGIDVRPYRESRSRRLYAAKKLSETPPGFPRRPGMAVKRPLR